jgi:hypothetical protein
MVFKLGWKPFGVLQSITSGQRSPSNQPTYRALDLNQFWYKHLEISPKFSEIRLYMAAGGPGLFP